jgi:hypothetical protein
MNLWMSFALTALLGLVLTTSPARAAVLKCKAADGSVTYTQTTCPPGTQNAEFSEHSDPNREAGAGDDGSASSKQHLSSYKSAMYRDLALACTEREEADACEMLSQAIDFCVPEKNWPSAACKSLREGMGAARDKLSMADPASRQRLREICAQGGELACKFQECPPSMFINGSDQQVRACAARAGLPVSATWIRLESRTTGDGVTGWFATSKYVCLKLLERTDSIGDRRTYRESVIVRVSAPRGGGRTITVSSLPDEEFATPDAAATAGCASTTAARPEVPRPKAKGNPQIT